MTRYGSPVWVMEPLRGGRLATLPEAYAERLASLRPDDKQPSACIGCDSCAAVCPQQTDIPA